MKYVKILGLLAVAAAALMAFAGVASADQVSTSTGGAAATPTVHATSVGHAILHNPIAKIECNSTVEGKVESHGAGKVVKGKITKLTFEPCTNSWHVTPILNGELELEATSNYNGNVYSVGTTVETTRFGITCLYATTTTTKIGTFTGGLDAKLDIEANIPFHGGSSFCGSTATAWTGTYTVNTPAGLFLTKT
jgi:hypothetical protein